MRLCFSDSLGLGAWIVFVSEGYSDTNLKTIFNLCEFLLPLLHVFFMSWNGKYWRSVKYNNGFLLFGFPWISCMNCVCTRGSWWSHLKTIFNLYIFLRSLLHIFFMSWSGKCRWSVKYNNGVVFFGFPWIRCMNCVCTRGS